MTIKTIIVLLLGFTLSAINGGSRQEGQRGIRIRVGAAPAESEQGEKPDLWAVVVGVSRYHYGGQNVEGSQIPNLKYAAEDAQAMSNFLLSDEGGGFREISDKGKLIILRDEQATKAGVEQALNTLKQAKPNDYYVLYFAAHGVLVPQADEKRQMTDEVPYFFLYDTDPSSQQSIEQTGLRMERVQQLLKEIPAKKGLVLTDTCHSAGVDMAGRGVRLAASRANARYIDGMSRIPEGVGFIAAARQTESSLERDSLGHGVFTWCLLEGLRGNADKDQDGVVIFDELAKYLSIEVPRLTDNQQHPHINTTKIGANRIALSEVRYGGAPCDPQTCGTLVVRAPELNEVMVSIDDGAALPLNSRLERTWKLRAGEHRLRFQQGEQREDLKANIEAGKSLFYEVNLVFTQTESGELVQSASSQVNVYLRDEKTPSSEAEDLYNRGVASYDRQEFEQAIDLLGRATAANGGAYADAQVYKGRAEQSLGRKREAVASFQEALRSRPTDYETRTLLAEARFNAGENLEETARELRAIIARHPNDDFARLVLGDLLLLRGDLVGAELQLRRAIRNRPLSPPAHLILADVLMDAGGKEAETARMAPSPRPTPNAKLAEALQEAERALYLFQELGRKRAVGGGGTGSQNQSISRVYLSGARYSSTAAIAECHHAVARALMQIVEYDDTQAGNRDYLVRARREIDEALRLAGQLRDPMRRVLATDTSARLALLLEDVPGAIRQAEEALKMAATIPALKEFNDPHYTLYSAYATSLDFAQAAEHLSRYLNGYRNKMKPEQRQMLEDELARLRRDARSQPRQSEKSKDKKKKKDN